MTASDEPLPLPDNVKPRYDLTRWLFLRCLGMVYLIVFASLWTQIDGLIGTNGLSPLSWTLNWAVDSYGLSMERFWRLPTIFWLSASNEALNAVCGAGVFLSVLLIIGVAPIPVCVLLWVFFLSIAQVGGRFLLFQWDGLLLEVGFVAIFLAPAQMLPGLARSAPSSTAVIWLMRWILFRLIFSSGFVKLSSGDPTWRDLSALSHHFETPPLPTWIGWCATWWRG